MAENSTPPSRRIKQRVPNVQIVVDAFVWLFVCLLVCLFGCFNENIVYRGNVFNGILKCTWHLICEHQHLHLMKIFK